MENTLAHPSPYNLNGFRVYGTPEVPTQAPTVDNAFLADLMTRQIELLEEQNRLLRKENSEWLTGDEAAEMLGKLITNSGKHLDVLRYLRKHKDKHLRTFGQLRPYTYLRREVEEVLNLVKAGRLVLP